MESMKTNLIISGVDDIFKDTQFLSIKPLMIDYGYGGVENIH